MSWLIIRTVNDYDVEVPYNYYILNVKLTARSIVSVAPELLTPEQLEMFNVYLETSGNNPLVFGGGSPDISPSEDISGVHFVNGTRPGNTAVVDIAKSQVGNVNGQPYQRLFLPGGPTPGYSPRHGAVLRRERAEFPCRPAGKAE